MKQPNVVYILADDLGIGDVTCYNQDSKIKTPNIDKIAKRGIRFTDAHAPSAVCTPSRYGILTGRYCWRSELKSSVLWPWDKALIEKDRPTLGTLYSQNGYNTMFVGKWHLGWNWKTTDGEIAGDLLPIGKSYERERDDISKKIDFSVNLDGGTVYTRL